MNKEEPTPLPTPLPATETKVVTLTFKVPHILKSISKDDNGFTHRDVREGGNRQIEFENTLEYSDQPSEETPFTVRVTNQLNFTGSIIDVINDEVELEDGFRLVPTVPTASEYLKRVGKKTLVGFSCRPVPQLSKQQGKPIYLIYRSFITLP